PAITGTAPAVPVLPVPVLAVPVLAVPVLAVPVLPVPMLPGEGRGWDGGWVAGPALAGLGPGPGPPPPATAHPVTGQLPSPQTAASTGSLRSRVSRVSRKPGTAVHPSPVPRPAAGLRAAPAAGPLAGRSGEAPAAEPCGLARVSWPAGTGLPPLSSRRGQRKAG